MKKYDVVAAGHICLDITPAFLNQGGESFDSCSHPGKLINVGNPPFTQEVVFPIRE
jgi:hypothetical protein